MPYFSKTHLSGFIKTSSENWHSDGFRDTHEGIVTWWHCHNDTVSSSYVYGDNDMCVKKDRLWKCQYYWLSCCLHRTRKNWLVLRFTQDTCWHLLSVVFMIIMPVCCFKLHIHSCIWYNPLLCNLFPGEHTFQSSSGKGIFICCPLDILLLWI